MTDMTLTGGAGGETLAGADGNDTIHGAGGDDTLNGGAGTDTATYDGVFGDYSITMVTGAHGRIVAFASVSDNESGNGDEGFDTLIDIERLVFANRTLDLTQAVQLFDQANRLVRTFGTIQDAIDAAQNNYTIRVGAGTFDEDLLIDVAVTIRGAHDGEAGTGRDGSLGAGETNIIGRHTINAAGNVTIDGVRFVNDATTTGGGAGNPTLKIVTGGTGGGHHIVNSVFWSSVAGGPNAVGDRAISLSPIATGAVTIADNLISGSANTDYYNGSSWNRGIWFDGGGVALTVTGNRIEWARTGINLDMSGSSTANVSNNSFHALGTSVSLGVDANGVTLSGNDYSQVRDDFNFRNLTSPVTFDASTAIDTLTASNPTDDPVMILGGGGGDDLTGTAGVDVIDGNNLSFTATDADELHGGGGNDFLFGRGGDDVLDGGAGDDTIDGGTGNDTVVFTGITSITPNGSGGWTVISADGTDTIAGVEAVVASGGGPATLVVGSGGFATIQAAVNAAQDGDTIVVAAGTYVEQVVVDGRTNLTIKAVTGAQVTIQAPADVVETARSSSDREIHAVFTAKNSTNIQLQNIDIDGAGAGNTVDENGGAGQANFYGVFYRNSSGGLTNVDVEHVRDQLIGGQISGVQRGVAVGTDNATPLAFSMTGGSISDFQKNATVFNGANLNVTGVTITGGGALGTIAQNGIQVLNSTGTISGNTITGIGFSGAANVYSGSVLAYGNTDLNITGNTIVGANGSSTDAKVVGILVFQLATANSGGQISGNTISYVDGGIEVTGDVTPNGIVIENNSITHIDGTNGDPSGVYFEPNPALATPYDVDGSPGEDFLSGGIGNDSLAGLGGDDLLQGFAGNDVLAGDGGTDTAVYAGVRNDYTIVTQVDGNGFVIGYTSVTDNAPGIAGDDGADTLTGVELLLFASGTLDLNHDVQLFDASNVLLATFDTVQAAVNAAINGQTIRIAAGTYNETVTVNKDVTIIGANEGLSGSDTRGAESILTGGVTITASGVTIDGVAFSGQGDPVAAGVVWPFGVFATGNDLVIRNSVFDTVNPTPANDIVGLVTGQVTGLEVSGNLFHGYSIGAYVSGGSSAGSFHGNLFQGDWSSGAPNDFFGLGNGVNSESSSVAVFENTFDALYSGAIQVLAFGPASIQIEDFVTNNTFENGRAEQPIQIYPNGVVGTVIGSNEAEAFRGDWAYPGGHAFNLYGVGGNDRLHGGEFNDLLSGGADNDFLFGNGGEDMLLGAAGVDTLSGGADDDTLDGGADNDTLSGDGGDDTLLGGAGVDTLSGGADNDTLDGGLGADALDGGAGTDTAMYDGTLATLDLSYSAGSWHVGGDTLEGVEVVTDGSGNVFRLVGANGTDGYGTIQAAVNAANPGDVILVAPGTYNENVVIGSDGLTLLSVAGRASTIIAGVQAGGELGTIQLAPGADHIIIGSLGAGFTIQGINGNGAIEKAAIYFQGPHDDISILDNELVANGDLAMVSEYNQGITNVLIDGNVISGKTFEGGYVSPVGVTQFDTGNNVARQLVALGGGSTLGVGNPSYGVTFTNNTISGTAGGETGLGTGVFIGNTLVTIDASYSVAQGNLFSGNTEGNGFALRTRGAGTDILDNALTGQSAGISINHQGTPGTYSGNSLTGTPAADVITSFTPGNDTLIGNGSDDVLTGGVGNDLVNGGLGTDTAAFNGARSTYTLGVTTNGNGIVTGFNSVSGGTDGNDTLVSIEKLFFSSGAVTLDLADPIQLFSGGVLAGTFTSIQAAVDAAVNGDTILVGAGTYDPFTVDVDVTIRGIGAVTVEGTFRAINSIPPGTSVGEWLQTATSYNGNGGVGAAIAADGVTLQNLTFTGLYSGVSIGNSNGLTLTNVNVSDSVNGVVKAGNTVAGNFTMTGGSITDGYHGFIVESNGHHDASFDGVVLNGVTFENLTEKGFYADNLSNAQLVNLIMTNVGEFGRGPAFGAPQVGEFGAGIDINLKYGSYANIEIAGFTFTDVGSSSTPDTVPLDFGAAIVVKARDDGPSYSGDPATLNNVSIHDGTINGTSTGVRIGEPGKNNAGPTGVTVSNVAITGADIAAFDNTSQAALTVVGTSGTDSYTSGATTVGPISFTGAGGGDSLAGGSGNDTLNGGPGDDTLTGGAGIDTATIAGVTSIAANGSTWTVVSSDGNDTLVGVEIVLDGGVRTLLVGSSGFATIQAAVDAAQAGDTVLVADGTYSESVVISKAITLQAVNPGGATIDPPSGNGITISGDIDGLGTATIAIDGINVNGGNAGIQVASSTQLDTLSVTNGSFTGNAVYAIGTGSGAPGLGNVIVTDSTFTDNGVGPASPNGSGAIVLFGFTGNATLEDLVITTTSTAATPQADRADNAIQLNGINPSTYDVTSPAGTIVFEDVVITGYYHKAALAIQGYTDLSGISFEDSSISTGSNWGYPVFIDPVVTSGDGTPGVAGQPGHFAGGAGDSTLDLSGLAVTNLSVSPFDVFVRGTDADDTQIGTGANDWLNQPSEGGIDRGGNDTLEGLGGDDALFGGTGDDDLDGGLGTDTAIYAGVRGGYAIDFDVDGNGFVTQFHSVEDTNPADGDEGTDDLTSIEALSFTDGAVTLDLADPIQLFSGGVLAGTFTSIQAAVDAAVNGDTILVGAGTYDPFTVDVDVTIRGIGAVTVEGTFRTANAIPNGVSVGEWLETATSYGGGGVGATIAADGVTLINLNFTGLLQGVSFGGSDNLKLDDVDISDSVYGVVKFGDNQASGFEMIGGSITDGYQGFTVDSTGGTNAEFDDVLLDGVTFENLTEKGFYADNLSNAQLVNLIMTNVGEFGRGPAFGAPQVGEFGAGIDINLKYGSYSNIEIADFTFTDVGSSSTPDTVPLDFGAAIVVKARDDGPSYSGDPATLSNVSIHDGTINGTSTGVRIGEPGKNNAGPTGVTVSNVAITGADIAAFDNASQAALTINGMAGVDNYTAGATSVGPMSSHGNGSNDMIAGGSGADSLWGDLGNDTIEGGAGNDHLYGGDGNDLLRAGSGRDVLDGGDGNDVFFYDDNLTALDINTGGSGIDTLGIQGNYSGLLFGANSLQGFEAISLQSGSITRWGLSGADRFDYNLIMVNANTTAGQQLVINGQSLQSGEDFTLNGGAETDGGRFLVYAGFGADVLTGGSGNDIFFFEAGRFGDSDWINGGSGIDSVAISGSVVGGPTSTLSLVIASGTFNGIEALTFNPKLASNLAALPSYSVVMENGNIDPGAPLVVNASTLTSVQTLDFDGSQVSDGWFRLFGGAGDDTLVGGSNNDVFQAGAGLDTLTGGGGIDTFQFRAVADSTSAAMDRILDLTVGTDVIDLSFIDADANTIGEQSFSFVGAAVFSHVAGELRAEFDVLAGHWTVQADVDGDGVADFGLLVTTSSAVPLVTTDFLL